MSGKKKDAAFNNPFQGLKLPPKEAPAPKKSAPPPTRRPKTGPEAPSSADDEAMMFFQAVGDARPIKRGAAPPPPDLTPRIQNEESEALAELAQLVAGHGTFDINDTDEYIEGGVANLEPRLVASLRRGEFALQGNLDLHGMTKAEAKEAVERFLLESRRAGRRCVLLIHGRGLHSKDNIPVLKEQLRVWLSRGRIGQAVLAFATARPYDGGAGALYVLLRK